MAFLDNSGDIILDAVLTDTGRQRLARGDGSFKIVQFALGDDEINYGLYDAANINGSAYYDIEILKTPIFEAFTNNIATMNSKLITIPRTNILYMPVIKLNNIFNPSVYRNSSSTFMGFASGSYVVWGDTTTSQKFKNLNASNVNAISNVVGLFNGQSIRVDQGLDNTAAGAATIAIDSDLKETAYLVEVDNRLLTVGTSIQNASFKDAAKSYVDDDQVAGYYFSLGIDEQVAILAVPVDETTAASQKYAIAGSRGTSLTFSLRPSADIAAGNTYLYDKYGSAVTTVDNTTTYTVKKINTNIYITGITTGYSVTVPVTLVKYVSG